MYNWPRNRRQQLTYAQTISEDLIRTIYDPEHPNTLEELRVVSAPQITVGRNHVKVEFTPTVPHCGMSTLIGSLISFSHLKGRGLLRTPLFPFGPSPSRLTILSPQVSPFGFAYYGVSQVGTRSIFTFNLAPTRVSTAVCGGDPHPGRY